MKMNYVTEQQTMANRGTSPFDQSRGRGILTESDRNYLAGESDLSEQGERDARYRIRNRLTDGLLDLAFLNRELQIKDQKQVAKNLFSNKPFGDGILTSMFQLLFRMDSYIYDSEDEWIDNIETIVSSAVHRELEREHEDALVNVTVDINPEIRRPDINKLVEKYEDWEETRDELRYLRDEGEIDTDSTYWKHEFQHHWDENEPFRILFEDEGMKEVDPDEYNTDTEFIEECLALFTEIPHGEENDESGE